MPEILFVNPKWCDGNPSFFLTNDFHNIVNSFRQSYSDYKYNTLHLDESSIIYGKHINETLIEYCLLFAPKIIILGLLGQSSLNPSNQCLKRLREMGIYLCIIWPDTGPGWGFGTIKEMGDSVNLNISWDNPRSEWHDKYTKPSNYLNLWTPEDNSLFYYHPTKDIDVSFVGSVDKYIDRAYFLDFLKQKNVNIYISGGQRRSKLNPERYSEIIRRSKMGVNFSMSQSMAFHQAKGRIFEYTACGGLLLESKNPSTADFFSPNSEYVEFVSPQDLLDKIDYYLAHEDERLAIAERGSKRYYKDWTSQQYWDIIMNRIKSEL